MVAKNTYYVRIQEAYTDEFYDQCKRLSLHQTYIFEGSRPAGVGGLYSVRMTKDEELILSLMLPFRRVSYTAGENNE